MASLLKNGLSKLSLMNRPTTENGRSVPILVTAKAYASGTMAASMKDIGKEILLMDMEGLYMLMEIFMMESGKMIKLMDMESIRSQMGLNMMENGLKINKMVMELRNGPMDHISKEPINQA